MDEFCLYAYERSTLYKERIKLYHDHKIEKIEFIMGDMVLFFVSKLKLFLGKLNSMCRGLYRVFPDGVIELKNKEV